jgi:allophanate hydrolase subunit 1
LLQPGDHVRFAPIDEERYLAVQQELDGTHE